MSKKLEKISAYLSLFGLFASVILMLFNRSLIVYEKIPSVKPLTTTMSVIDPVKPVQKIVLVETIQRTILSLSRITVQFFEMLQSQQAGAVFVNQRLLQVQPRAQQIKTLSMLFCYKKCFIHIKKLCKKQVISFFSLRLFLINSFG